ncbi:MAG: DUF523 and DUF1722 domain-containing protein [Deltaproteobacteria bacterium]|nr:DUF523 and DUF1722 domain-containing protein [Deltaproteobacteria bacterium]
MKNTDNDRADDKLRIGISACLLGHPVRYDGGHKHDRFLTDTLGRYVEYVPVCPEVECGLGVPREAMRLIGSPDKPRLITIKTRQDITPRMTAWAGKRLRELEAEGLCGFIFKSKSPSSGMERVKVYGENGVPSGSAAGIFARAFMDYFPLIPCEEEGRLHDPALRENFVERIFTARRWRRAVNEQNRLRAVVDFHTRNKYLLMSHSTKHLSEMGRIVAEGKKTAIRDVVAFYQALLMEALALKATSRKHANVLMHMLGYFKKELNAAEKQEMLAVIDEYRREWIPLIVPVTLMNHYIQKYGQAYLKEQTYLNPHPAELRLRNHV